MTPPTDAAVHTARALRVAGEFRKRALDPIDRFSEVIFGLIMVLAFTGTVSVAAGGSDDVHKMLVAALACNLAWGLVDGMMYVLTSIAERSRRGAVIRGIRSADPAVARSMVLATLPEGLQAITDDAEADRIVSRIRALSEAPNQRSLTLEDVWGALGSALLVMVATLPPILPFLLLADAGRALRISNGVAVASLFLAGFWLGRACGARAWRMGFAMVVLGGGMVVLTIALGG